MLGTLESRIAILEQQLADLNSLLGRMAPAAQPLADTDELLSQQPVLAEALDILDLFYVVDVSDITDGAWGSSKQTDGNRIAEFVGLQGYIKDAPSDGSQYARQDAAWAVVDATIGGNANTVVIADGLGGAAGDASLTYDGTQMTMTNTAGILRLQNLATTNQIYMRADNAEHCAITMTSGNVSRNIGVTFYNSQDLLHWSQGYDFRSNGWCIADKDLAGGINYPDMGILVLPSSKHVKIKPTDATDVAALSVQTDADDIGVSILGHSTTLDTTPLFTVGKDTATKSVQVMGSGDIRLSAGTLETSGIYFNDGVDDGYMTYDHALRTMTFSVGGGDRIKIIQANIGLNTTTVNNLFQGGCAIGQSTMGISHSENDYIALEQIYSGSAAANVISIGNVYISIDSDNNETNRVFVVEHNGKDGAGTPLLTVHETDGTTINGNVVCPSLPTSASGLPSGALWNNAGVVNVAP